MGTKIDFGYDYEKLLSSIRGFYTGAGYYGALIVLDRAREVHSGLRKNGFPEFSHQLMQVAYLRMVQAGVMYPEATHVVMLAHDLDEDYNVTPAETMAAIRNGCPVHWSGWREYERMGPALSLMNKEGKKTEAYYRDISEDPIASLAKGEDRDHNLGSMIEAFTPQKQRSYIAETREHTLPMLRRARKLFPGQEPIYQNLRHEISVKIYMAEQILALRDLQVHTRETALIP